MKKLSIALLTLGIASQSFAGEVTCKLAAYRNDGTISNLVDGKKLEINDTTQTGITRSRFKAKGAHGLVIVESDNEQIKELTICSSADCSAWEHTTIYPEPGTKKVRSGLSVRSYNNGTYAECVLE